MTAKPLYIFVDESGNFDFSTKGSRYFTLTCVSMQRAEKIPLYPELSNPFPIYNSFDGYKHFLLENSQTFNLKDGLESFHCSEDNKIIRKNMFTIIARHLTDIRIDSLIVEKRKLKPELQNQKSLYSRMFPHLLNYTIKGSVKQLRPNQIIVIADNIAKSSKRHAIKMTVAKSLKHSIPTDTVPYRLFYHASKAHYGLQLVDYCSWAIFRKWEKGDTQHHAMIQSAIKSEHDIFKGHRQLYY